MFSIFKSVTKAALGIVFSPVSIAADIVTMGGVLADRDEPYTVSAVRNIMANMNSAVDPNELTDDQLKAIARELNKHR